MYLLATKKQITILSLVLAVMLGLAIIAITYMFSGYTYTFLERFFLGVILYWIVRLSIEQVEEGDEPV